MLLTVSFVGVVVFPLPNPSPSIWASSVSGLLSLMMNGSQFVQKASPVLEIWGGSEENVGT